MAEPRQPPTSPLEVQLQGHWESADDVPIVLANQLLAQVIHGNAVLTFGQAVPPVLGGTPEQQAAQARELESIPIRTLARFAVPIGPLREIAAALQSTLAALDAEARQG